MIRAVWVTVAVGFQTLWLGALAVLLALFRYRGPLYNWITQTWARSVLWASATPVVIEGAEHVRPGEPQVIVSNHVSWYDVFAIAGTLHVPFHFVAKQEVTRIPVWGPAFLAAGHISIDRSNRERALASLAEAGEKIRRERSSVVIFPEGTRSRTGRLQPFKKGAFMLALKARVPIVPCVVIGSYDIMRPDDWRIHPRPILVRYGEPISPAGYGERNAEELMERVRGEMARMLEEADALPPLGPGEVG